MNARPKMPPPMTMMFAIKRANPAFTCGRAGDKRGPEWSSVAMQWADTPNRTLSTPPTPNLHAGAGCRVQTRIHHCFGPRRLLLHLCAPKSGELESQLFPRVFFRASIPAAHHAKQSHKHVGHGRSPTAVMLLEQDSFLTQLTRMFDRTRDKGTVYITTKRYTGGALNRKSRAAQAKAEQASGQVPESKVLVRAVAGKAKISTLVPAKDQQRFSTSLMNITKVKMDGLKRREKAPRSKSTKA